jgi:hypothetical protein
VYFGKLTNSTIFNVKLWSIFLKSGKEPSPYVILILISFNVEIGKSNSIGKLINVLYKISPSVPDNKILANAGDWL